jgi:hypothetical protein
MSKLIEAPNTPAKSLSLTKPKTRLSKTAIVKTTAAPVTVFWLEFKIFRKDII